MEWLTVLAGILLRLVVPVTLTLGIGWLLYKLDARWKAEAEIENASAPKRSMVPNSGCWKDHKCAPEKRDACPAYLHQEIPCWQVFRLPDGSLKSSCLGCKTFREAPVPARM